MLEMFTWCNFHAVHYNVGDEFIRVTCCEATDVRTGTLGMNLSR